MPFGLHNAPATFQRLMNQVLAGCHEFAQAYLDDVVIHSMTWEEHLQHLHRVFTYLKKTGLTLKLSKCQFGLNKVLYLGHVIGNGDVQPDPRTLEAVESFSRPETKTENSNQGRLATIEKECLAVVWAPKSFEHYLYGQKFTLFTDHMPLTWLKTMRNSNQRLTRWAVYLQQFKFEVRHRPGSKHKNADGLFRRPPGSN